VGEDLQLGGGRQRAGPDLAAGCDLQRDLRHAQRRVELGHPAGQRCDVDEVDVRRADDEAGAVRYGQTGEGEGLVKRPRPVIDSGQEVEVQFDVRVSQ